MWKEKANNFKSIYNAHATEYATYITSYQE